MSNRSTGAIESGWETSVRLPLSLAVELAAALGYHGKTLTSSNVLIPVAYYLRKIGSPAGFCTAPKYAEHRASIRKWLVASLLKSVLSSKTDTVLAAVRTAIRDSEEEGFPLVAVEKALLGHGVTMRFSDEELDNLKASGFGEDAIIRVQELMNQIPNLQFLEGLVNQSKLDSTFAEWIAPMQAKPAEWALYQQQHAIPVLLSYGLDQFESFFKQRRLLFMSRLKQVLG
jgi:hypothetical protein